MIPYEQFIPVCLSCLRQRHKLECQQVVTSFQSANIWTCRISSSVILEKRVAHVWCLIRIIQYFPRMKPTLFFFFLLCTHLPFTLGILGINSIHLSEWQAHETLPHKHSPVQLHSQHPELWVIHLWIRIQRLFLRLPQFKTTWLLTLIIALHLAEMFFHKWFYECACMQELSFLPVYDCTHV